MTFTCTGKTNKIYVTRFTEIGALLWWSGTKAPISLNNSYTMGRFGRMAMKHVKYHVGNELPVQVRSTILDAWG